MRWRERDTPLKSKGCRKISTTLRKLGLIMHKTANKAETTNARRLKMILSMSMPEKMQRGKPRVGYWREQIKKLKIVLIVKRWPTRSGNGAPHTSFHSSCLELVNWTLSSQI